MNIFLAGASGFVGERVLDDLLAVGHDVTALVHSDRSRDTLVEAYPKLSVTVGDVTSPDAMLRTVKHGTDAVICLPGLLREAPKKGLTFQGVHVEGVKNLLAVAKKVGASRWIQMSALGTQSRATTAYYRTKWEAEERVRASGLDWTILRPSLIFDDRPRKQHHFIAEIAKAIRMSPFIPILGNGEFLLQPVSVDDVSQTVVQCLSKSETIGNIYEMGGPDKWTYRDLVLTIAHTMGSKKPPVKIPLWAITSIARMLDRFSWFPITSDEIAMLRNGNYVHDPAQDRFWREAFDLPMKRFSESVANSIE